MVEKEIEQGEESLDESFEDFDEDFDAEIDGEEDLDLGEIEEEEDDDDDEAPKKGKRSDDYATDAALAEVALKANPKRAQARKRAATMVEGVLNYAELSKPEGQLKAWESMNQKTESVVPKAYSLKAAFLQNDTIEHTKFGIGFVLEELSDTKISVLFEDGIRKLVCDNRSVE